MTDTLTHPRKLFKEDRITTSNQIHISSFANNPTISKNVLEHITASVIDAIQDPFFKKMHVDMLNNYYDALHNNRRRPSSFQIYELTKSKLQSWYNSYVYESYTNFDADARIIDALEFDEPRSNSGTDIPTCELDCVCIYNYKKFPLFQHNFPLFGRAVRQFNSEYINTNTIYEPILVEMKNPSKWAYFRTDLMDINLYYSIKYNNQTFYITYNLLGVYVLMHDFKDPNLTIKAKTAIIDPFLRALLTSRTDFNESYKMFPIKCGLYYVDVTEYEPQLKYKNMGVKSNLTYNFYKSKININNNPLIKIPKIFMKISLPNKIRLEQLKKFFIKKQKQMQLKINDYDSDKDEVCIGYFETTIIYNNKINYIPRVSPSIDISTNIDEYVKIIVLEPPIHISAQLKPLKIIFKSNIGSMNIIKKSLTDCYLQSIPFQNHVNQYTCIKIIKGIHTDMNRLDKSRHFTAVFLTNDYESSCYHLYIDLDNKINSITTIINIL